MNRTLQAAAGRLALWICPAVSDDPAITRHIVMIAASGAIIVRIADQVTIDDDGGGAIADQIVCTAMAGKFSIVGIDAKLKPKRGKPM